MEHHLLNCIQQRARIIQPKLRDPSFVAALVYFDRVAAHLSFSRAAQELSVTTSAVSHRIKRLEIAMGRRLFSRDRTQVVLTQAGYELRAATQDAFGTLDRVVETATCQRTLRVSVGPYLSVAWLMPLLGKFEALDQGARIELVHQIGKPDFRDVDIAIWWTEPERAGAHARQLFSSTMVPVAKAHTQDVGAVWDQGLPPLHYRTRRNWSDWLSRAGGPEDFAKQGEVFEDPNIVLEAAALGRGIALGFAPFVQSHISSGRLQRISDVAVPSAANYFLIVSVDNDRQCADFTEWLYSKAMDMA
ncbi:LysR family transcriptional regulator [Roseibium sp. HPY-6]|uniref:LysR family transcriptional regulator n=1 Tax=Roseibium sp. HPY-6 TaxID=3229852 RepID=UPI00338F2759